MLARFAAIPLLALVAPLQAQIVEVPASDAGYRVSTFYKDFSVGGPSDFQVASDPAGPVALSFSVPTGGVSASGSTSALGFNLAGAGSNSASLIGIGATANLRYYFRLASSHAGPIQGRLAASAFVQAAGNWPTATANVTIARYAAGLGSATTDIYARGIAAGTTAGRPFDIFVDSFTFDLVPDALYYLSLRGGLDYGGTAPSDDSGSFAVNGLLTFAPPVVTPPDGPPPVSVVPEPGTWAMMILGFCAVGMAMRRQRRPHPVMA